MDKKSAPRLPLYRLIWFRRYSLRPQVGQVPGFDCHALLKSTSEGPEVHGEVRRRCRAGAAQGKS